MKLIQSIRMTGAAFAACTALAVAGCAVVGPAHAGQAGGTGHQGTPTPSTPITPGPPSTPGTPRPLPPMMVRDGAGAHTVTVTVGQRLEVILSSTYWFVAGSSRPSVVRQDGPTSDLPKPSNCGSIPGLGCVPTRTDFTALVPGTAVITAGRTSCGEAMLCQPAQRHYTLTVIVLPRS